MATKITYTGRLSSVVIPRLGIKAKRGEAVEVDDVIAKRAMAECPDLFTTSSSPKKKEKAGGDK